MQMTAFEWCSLLNGKLEGNGNNVITHPAKIEEAGEGAISFIANLKYASFAYTTHASALIVHSDAALDGEIVPALIRVDNPSLAFTRVLENFNSPYKGLNGIEHPVFIHPSASIGENVYIGAFSYIGENVKIEKNVKVFPQTYIGEESHISQGTILFPGVKIYKNSLIGSDCIIHAGAVIGSDGFGFVPQPDGTFIKVPQLGNVVVEDNVEIGANTTVDRATMGSTIIRSGVKIDNLVQIAHNVEVGEHTAIAAQTGISGSTKIGKHCMIGGQAGIVGHIQIEDGARINAQSGVSKTIKEKNKAVTGSPAFDYTSSLRAQALFRNLPDMAKRLNEVEKKIEALKEKRSMLINDL
ncbi:MAG: UDP-3-O-(3-hydroxymyristoyl)glucosamine N-acyltransferase [Chitinophagales bacterium]|nr:UDP-3-O-(3-hydroxymyristoyl)glucosamine N-acyltransferase [Chitinophagales bacterium]